MAGKKRHEPLLIGMGTPKARQMPAATVLEDWQEPALALLGRAVGQPSFAAG